MSEQKGNTPSQLHTILKTLGISLLLIGASYSFYGLIPYVTAHIENSNSKEELWGIEHYSLGRDFTKRKLELHKIVISNELKIREKEVHVIINLGLIVAGVVILVMARQVGS